MYAVGKTKRIKNRKNEAFKKGFMHNAKNKARNKSQNHSISGFIKHNSTTNIIAFK